MKCASRLMPIFAFILAALFLCYEMGLQAAMGVMTHELMRDFHTNANALGWMHAGYFVAYTAMQIPAGLLFDRYSTRGLISVAILLCVVGSFIFCFSEELWLAIAGRFFEGLGSAFAFIGTLVVASRWFEGKWFALLVGIAQALAALGAMSAGAPLALAIQHWGWRETLMMISGFGALLVPLVWFVLQQQPCIAQPKRQSEFSFQNSLKMIIKDKNIWWIAIYAFCAWAPVTIFAELWGENFLTQLFPISTAYAGGMIAMIWIGLTLTSPVLGWFSEACRTRKKPAFCMAFIGVFSTIVLLYFNSHEWLAWLCLIGFGMAASGQILTFAMVKDYQPPALVGTAIGMINMAVVAGGAILGPLASTLLHTYWHGELVNQTPYYNLVTFRASLWLLPLCFFAATVVAGLLLKETHPKKGANK